MILENNYICIYTGVVILPSILPEKAIFLSSSTLIFSTKMYINRHNSEVENLNMVRWCHNTNPACDRVLHCHHVLQHPHICKLLCGNIIQPFLVFLLWYRFDISASKSCPFITVSSVASQVLLYIKNKSQVLQLTNLHFCYFLSSGWLYCIFFKFSPQINKMFFSY